GVNCTVRVTPMLYWVVSAAPLRGGRKSEFPEDDSMYDKILVPLDGSELAECALPHVLELAKGCHVGEVILLRICEPPTIRADYPSSLPEGWERHVERLTEGARGQCGLYLDDVQKRLEAEGISVKTVSGLGDPSEEIVGYASRNNVDLIVMTSHGRRGVKHWAMGSVAERVFRATCVPVLMVRAPGCPVGK
ncbi:MAG: universal stress protein, partial [Dehalococcoidia bacterium]|nr:universal stress protein [Dehalococcoidia bacterium]